jgi:hypothetical protein
MDDFIGKVFMGDSHFPKYVETTFGVFSASADLTAGQFDMNRGVTVTKAQKKPA